MASGIDQPIGIFDSGIGGLSFVEAIRKELPAESIAYFADLKNLPYGEKTREEVLFCATQVTLRLKEQKSKIFVVACSTASAVAAESLADQVTEPVIGVLNPFFLNDIVSKTKSKKVGVISTELTHQSKMFVQWIKEGNPFIEVISAPASKLVNAISEGDLEAPKIRELVSEAISTFIGKVDVLVLGCTHFNFVESVFRELLPENIQIASAPKPTAKLVRALLETRGESNLEPNPKCRVESSLYDPKFEAFVEKRFGHWLAPASFDRI